MPIYAYRCEACGHAKDVLQKMSDVPLHICPSCGADAFRKQVTAAGFQLKGSGWYVTDFRGGSSGAAAPASGGGSGGGGGSTSGDSGSGGSGSSSGGSGDGGGSTPAASAAGCGSSCACH